MAIDFDFDPVEQAMADSVAAFCRDRVDAELLRAAANEFPLALWKDMAALGVLFFEVLFVDMISPKDAQEYIGGLILLGAAPEVCGDKHGGVVEQIASHSRQS